MQVEGALIREQGQEFAVIVVKQHIVTSPTEANQAIASLEPTFDRPVVLMAQDKNGRTKWFGRKDIVRFMSRVSVRQIPWQKFTIH